MNDKVTQAAADELLSAFAQRLNSVRLSYFIKNRSDGLYLIFQAVEPSEHLYRSLREAQAALPEDHLFKDRATIEKRKGVVGDRVHLPETHLLRAILSESLNADQHTFGEDFFDRYIRSVFGYEEQIVSEGNFLVYGRRGSGKSSLLAYAMHHRRKQRKPYAWVGMQAYGGRADIHVSTDIVSDILRQLEQFGEDEEDLSMWVRRLDDMATMDENEAETTFQKSIPRIARVIAEFSRKNGETVFFIDDIHVLSPSFQPKLLGHLYSISRGNRCHMKISGIEQFSRPWSASDNVGLEAPHDAQVLKLDYNLTMPEKSKSHIESILDAHAKLCGLPSVNYVSGAGVLSRLVWVAAAVPRDALHLFAQAITRATSHDEKRVSVTSVNLAASEIVETKLRDMEQDHSGKLTPTRDVLEQLKTFCVKEKHQNAVLVEIRNDDEAFHCVQDLIALRLVHVLHEGITPHEAGRRYQALMLDYGLYVGIRLARSVNRFRDNARIPSAKDLRSLPVFRPKVAATGD